MRQSKTSRHQRGKSRSGKGPPAAPGSESHAPKTRSAALAGKDRPEIPKSLKRTEAHTKRGDGVVLYGRHAVLAAFANAKRRLERLYVSDDPDEALAAALAKRPVDTVRVERRSLDARAGEAGAHQGIVLECSALVQPPLEECVPAEGPALVLVLDQITDSRNTGAILRSAAAFGVAAVIVQTRHAAPLNGACAKAASGALERIPVVQEVNLARTMAQLQGRGFWLLGLDGAAAEDLANLTPSERQALVLGAEGRGLRQLIAQRCDRLARISILPDTESLNVSVAAGIALAHCTRGRLCPSSSY